MNLTSRTSRIYLAVGIAKATGPNRKLSTIGVSLSRLRKQGSEKSAKKNLAKLQANPRDVKRQNKVTKEIEKHPQEFFGALKQLVDEAQPSSGSKASANGPGPVPVGGDPDWVNCVGEQKCTPVQKLRPQSLKNLVDIVNDAKEKKRRVRAVGSGHAFSDIARTDDAVLVDPVLLNDVTAVDASQLHEESKGLNLVNVQSGIILRNLKEVLDNRGQALINMGGYDGQTISGTFSTGTHGSGITFGPMASFAKAIVFVAENGLVYQVESTKGITDPTKFTGKIDGVDVILKQDDDWFRSLMVAMGCLGLIYSYIIEVTNAYSVRELRSSTTWNDVKGSLTPDKWNPVPKTISDYDHFELVLNPYNRWFRNACIKVQRTRLGNVPKEGERQDWVSAILEQVSINSAPQLIDFLNKIPFVSPLVIDQAIMTLVEKKPYTDKSFNVFSLGPANDLKATALELHCDASQCVPVIDKLLEVFSEEARKRQWYMAGPLGIRFVAPSEAFVAPEAGRMTCTIELDMLVGVTTGKELSRSIKERLCNDQPDSVRVHWGLDLDFITKEDFQNWYPGYGKWLKVYRELNSAGMFNNKFTDRMSISVS